MPTQSTTWIALPNGLQGEGVHRTVRLSAFVAPSLGFDGAQTQGKLAAFPELLDWPARLRSTDFGMSVKVGDDDWFSARVVTTDLLDSKLWKALFNAETLVRQRSSPWIGGLFRSYPAAELAYKVRNGYGALVGRSPFKPADNAGVQAAFPELHQATRAKQGPGPSLRSRLASAVSETEMLDLHQELAGDMLRLDPELSLAEKVLAAGRLAEALARSPQAAPVLPIVPKTPDAASAFAQLAAFHQPAATGEETRRATGPLDDEPDFHQLLSMLAEYPLLLRRLGIVIDLELDAEAFAKAIPDRKSRPGALTGVSVRPKIPPGGEPYAPATKFVFDLQPGEDHRLPFPHFFAAPRAWEAVLPGNERAEVVGGLLNLSLQPDGQRSQFDLLQVDLDGAGLKLLNTMRSIVNDPDEKPAPVGGRAEQGAPTLRSSGISIVRAEQPERLLFNLAAAKVHEAAGRDGTPQNYFAEDLVRGHRIDMRRFPRDHQVGGPDPPSAAWLSLHKRVGTFAFGAEVGDISLSAVHDEGFVQPAVVQDAGARASAPVRVHESMMTWRGWSLAAPPPMHTSDGRFPGTAGASAGAGQLPNVTVAFEPEAGSLSSLRFGHYYQLRARTVDLGGNGLTVAEADAVLDALRRAPRALPILFEAAQDFFRYRRFEPIDAPAIVLRADPREGETEDTLVVRSLGTPPNQEEETFQPGHYNTDTDRHIVPPKTTLELVEKHGVLDTAFGPTGNPSEAYNICRKLDGTLKDRSVINVRTGQAEPLPDMVITDPVTGTQTRIENGIRTITLGERDDAVAYAIHYEDQLLLPYLPDPIVSGAALFGLPGLNAGSLIVDDVVRPVSSLIPASAQDALGLLTKISFGKRSEWYDKLPFRLRLTGLSGDAHLEAPEWDASARVLTVRLASGSQAIIWASCYPDERDVLEHEQDPATQIKKTKTIMGVHHWSLRLADHPDERLHFNNTAPHGALSMLSPARRLKLVHAVQRPVRRPEQRLDSPFRADKLVPGDTFVYIGGKFRIHSSSTEKLDLIATWSERGEREGGAGSKTVTTHVLEVPVHEIGSSPAVAHGQVAPYDHAEDIVTFPAPATSTEAQAKRYLARHEFGDTKHRHVTYQLYATSRFREYFPKSASDQEEFARFSCSSPAMSVNIKSSATPADLEIGYIVPAFKSPTPMEDEAGRVTTSHRLGGTLRVYLGRTWNSSGDGEQLAVLNAQMWGADPVHSKEARGSVTPTARPAEEVTARRVYPYEVFFDEQGTKLWYSDISFDVKDIYFPFIKLELARFQKHSLPTKHLSASRFAGFHQLTPNRTVSLDYSGEGREVTVAVTGFGPSGDRIGHLLEATLEERAAARQDWDWNLGWTSAMHIQLAASGATSANEQRWSGRLPTGSDSAGQKKQRRLVIREFELFPRSDGVPGQAWLGGAAGDTPAETVHRRLIYADTIPLI